MTVSIVDVKNLPPLKGGKGKKILFDSPGFHVWVHGTYPGHCGPMHRHTADETFYCVDGEVTFHFKDGPSQTLTPGMVIVIPKDVFYAIANTGSVYHNVLGTRAEAGKKPRFGDKGDLMPARNV